MVNILTFRQHCVFKKKIELLSEIPRLKTAVNVPHLKDSEKHKCN